MAVNLQSKVVGGGVVAPLEGGERASI